MAKPNSLEMALVCFSNLKTSPGSYSQNCLFPLSHPLKVETSGAFPPPGPLGGCPSSLSKARSFKRPMLLSSDVTLALTKLSCPCPQPQSFTLWVLWVTANAIWPIVATYPQSIHSVLQLRKTSLYHQLVHLSSPRFARFHAIEIIIDVHHHLGGRKGLYTIPKLELHHYIIGLPH